MIKCARMDMTKFVFVHHITTQLNLERIEKDLANLSDQVEQYAFEGPRPCCGRGSMIFLIYYADSMDSAASAKIVQSPRVTMTSVTFLAAQDGQGQSFFYEGHPWDGGLQPELRYWAGLLTGRDVGNDGPPHPMSMRQCFGFVKMGLVAQAIGRTIYSPDGHRWNYLLAFALMFVIVVILERVYDWIQSRCQKKDQSTDASLVLSLKKG
jgi:hypothetical protein